MYLSTPIVSERHNENREPIAYTITGFATRGDMLKNKPPILTIISRLCENNQWNACYYLGEEAITILEKFPSPEESFKYVIDLIIKQLSNLVDKIKIVSEDKQNEISDEIKNKAENVISLLKDSSKVLYQLEEQIKTVKHNTEQFAKLLYHAVNECKDLKVSIESYDKNYGGIFTHLTKLNVSEIIKYLEDKNVDIVVFTIMENNRSFDSFTTNINFN